MSKLHFEITGSGTDLVLLHGWGLNLHVWDGLVAQLRDQFRVITLDLPGHGRSEWNAGDGTPAELAWMIHDTLVTVSQRYSLLGWSLGGQIALDLTAAMPNRIERLILVATTPKFTAGPDWPHGMEANALAELAAQLRTNYRGTVHDFLELQVHGSPDDVAVVEHLRHTLLVHGEAQPRALLAGLNTLAINDLRASLPHVRVPVLVIAGQHDRVTPPAASRALAEALPDARYAELRHAAHAPFLSHGKEFARLVAAFLSSPAAVRRRPKKMRAQRRAGKKRG
jgi:pimeloyl-[acyl-carrier protein] methyl ester esterase